MRIYFNTKNSEHKKIIRELNKYWKTLSYEKTVRKKENFYNPKYNFYVDRHSIHIWKEKEDLTEKELFEIKNMLLIIFKNDIIGSVDISRTDEDCLELIEAIKEIRNLQFFNLLHTKSNYSKEELEKCYNLINNIEKTSENENQIYIIKKIITQLMVEK